MAVVATVLALLLVQDKNNPHLYGLRSYATYPSLLRWPFVSSPAVTWQEDLDQITEADAKFIEEKTRPDERVLVIALRDWAYLAQAHRAPMAYFMPFLVSFDARFLDRSMNPADRLFYDSMVERRPEYHHVQEVMKRVKRDFVAVETRGNLTLYERRRP